MDDWVLVNSSTIKAVRYFDGALYIKFYFTGEYKFFDFPEPKFNEFLSSDSIGQYFNNQVKDNYKWRKL